MDWTYEEGRGGSSDAKEGEMIFQCWDENERYGNDAGGFVALVLLSFSFPFLSFPFISFLVLFETAICKVGRWRRSTFLDCAAVRGC